MISGNDTWCKAILHAPATLQEAIQNLDASAMQIVLVVSDDNLLLGTITDGDIRRALLRGLTMSSPIDSVIHRDAFVAPLKMNRETVLHLMQANSISALPVVDQDRRVVGLHVLKELLSPAERRNLMVVMAGGRGRRLAPHTESCPKPLLPVAGKPMLEHIVERAKLGGFRQFIFAIHYLGDMVKDYFGDGSRWEVQISYVREAEPLGTAGAIGLIEPRPESPFVVTNGDVITDVHYGELLDFHCRHDAAATMAVRLHEWEHPFGVVKTRGVEIIGIEEKPVVRTHINAGIYVLAPAALDVLGKGERCDMPQLFGRLQEKGARTIVYPMHEPWLDVGRPDDYVRANNKRER